MNYAAVSLTCPLCSNKLGVDFIGKKCPNPECLYKFGRKGLDQKNSSANDKRVLRAVKKAYKDATLNARQLRKEFSLMEEDIAELKADMRYGESRYFREEVASYLRTKKPKNPKQKQLSLI